MDWPERYRAGLRTLRGFVGTAEDIRVELVRKRRLSEPAHHNAWGAVAKNAKERGLLVPTGERRPMRLDRSHSRETAVYRVK